MQGLVVVGLIVEEIWNVDVKYVKVTGAGNIGQYIEEKHYWKFGGYRPYSWGDFERQYKMFQSH